jgi:nitrous oxidase accessory protein NosD
MFEFIIKNNNFNGFLGLNFTLAKNGCCKEFVIYNNFINCSTNIKMWKDYSDDYPIFHYNNIGNFWNDYLGTDNDGDGIGDSPYYIAPDIQDNYPLMSPP